MEAVSRLGRVYYVVRDRAALPHLGGALHQCRQRNDNFSIDMSETEDLKLEAYRSKVASQMNALFDYIDQLFGRGMEERLSHTRDAIFTNCLLLAYMIVVLASIFVHVDWYPIVVQVSFLLYFLKVFHSWFFEFAPLMRTNAELDGCFRTLEILGYIPPTHKDRYEEHKKKESAYEKAWKKVQSFLKGKVYA